MPLLDHFRPPLSLQRHWHAFHNSWATYISSHLNQRLPDGYFAEANVQFGIEIDVATFTDNGSFRPGRQGDAWTPPAPTQTVPFTTATDIVEVLVFAREGGPTLAGAIELVSPANKDRSEHRDAFVSKCVAYLQQGIGLAIVDVVTSRKTSLHSALLARLNVPQASGLQANLYAIAYRPIERDGGPSLDLWEQELEVGKRLPTVPLWLPGGLCLPIDLDATYERTCQEQRVLANGN